MCKFPPDGLFTTAYKTLRSEKGVILLRIRNYFKNKFIYAALCKMFSYQKHLRQNPLLKNLGIFCFSSFSSRVKFPPKSSLIDPHLPNVSSAMLAILFSTSGNQKGPSSLSTKSWVFSLEFCRRWWALDGLRI